MPTFHRWLTGICYDRRRYLIFISDEPIVAPWGRHRLSGKSTVYDGVPFDPGQVIGLAPRLRLARRLSF